MTEQVQKAGQGKPVLLTITDRFFGSHIAKLRPGSILQGEVTQLLNRNKVLIRLLNKEIVAKTNLPLAQGEKLKFWVKKQGLSIILEVLGKSFQKSGTKLLLLLLKELGLDKFAFNPLNADPAKEFKKLIKSKKILKQLIDLISRDSRAREKIMKALAQLHKKESYFYIPIYFPNRNLIVKGRISGTKTSNNQEIVTLCLSVDTINLGIIEVRIIALPVLSEGKKRINISFFASTFPVADYLKSKLPELSETMKDIGFVPGKFTVEINPYATYFREDIEVLA